MVGFRSSATGAVLPLEFTSDGKVHTVMLPSTVIVSGAETYASAARAGLGLKPILFTLRFGWRR